MPFIEKDGDDIYYLFKPATSHERKGTIVFLHTNVSDHTIYHSIVSRLNKTYDIVLYDMRGFGNSEQGQAEISVNTYVKDLYFLIQSLQLGSVHLVSMGFGSLVALSFSLSYEHLVHKSVLISPVCFPEDAVSSVRQHRREQLIKHHHSLSDAFFLDFSTIHPPDTPEYKKLEELIHKTDPFLYDKVMELVISGDPVSYMQNISSIPTLILFGEKEVLFPPHLLEFNAVYLKNYYYTTVPNAASFLMIDQPELTELMIEKFLLTQDRKREKDDAFIDCMQESMRQYTQNIYTEGHSHQVENTIQVDLMNSFHVRVNGKPITHGWNQRYAKQILIYLIFHPTATRENLCSNLWPDVPLTTAKKNLRVYLSHLRQLLHSYPTPEPVLVNDREHVFLNGKIISRDLDFVQNVESAYYEGDYQVKYEKVLKLLKDAATGVWNFKLYDDWYLDLCRRVEHRLVDLIVWLGEWLDQNNQTDEAIKHLRKVVHEFEENEAIFDTIIALYEKQGNTNQAAHWRQEKEKLWGYW